MRWPWTTKRELKSLLLKLLRKVNQLMATEQETLAKLQTLDDKLTKIGGESSAMITEIADLKAQIAGLPVPASVMEKIDSILGHAQAIDDQVPDPPSP